VRSGQILEILAQAAAAVEPSERPFDDPSAWQHLEPARRIGSLDDLDVELRKHTCDRTARIVAPDTRRRRTFCAGKGTGRTASKSAECRHRVPGYRPDERWHEAPGQPYRRGYDASCLDLLACVVAVRINVAAAFSVLFTLWLSITHAVGLASRCIISRHCR